MILVGFYLIFFRSVHRVGMAMSSRPIGLGGAGQGCQW